MSLLINCFFLKKKFPVFFFTLKEAKEIVELSKQQEQAEEEKRRQEALLEEQNQIANEILKRDLEQQDEFPEKSQGTTETT